MFHIDDLDPEPWKNGGGTTRTIAVEPAGSGFNDFRWRVSVAEVRESGTFSLFPGVDRTIVLLDGAGMELSCTNGTRTLLNKPFALHDFPGEAAIEATLLGGPTRDLNVMVRRGRARARLQIWFSAASLPADVPEAVFFCPQGSFRIGINSFALMSGNVFKTPKIAAKTALTPVLPDSILIGVMFDE